MATCPLSFSCTSSFVFKLLSYYWFLLLLRLGIFCPVGWLIPDPPKLLSCATLICLSISTSYHILYIFVFFSWRILLNTFFYIFRISSLVSFSLALFKTSIRCLRHLFFQVSFTFFYFIFTAPVFFCLSVDFQTSSSHPRFLFFTFAFITYLLLTSLMLAQI